MFVFDLFEKKQPPKDQVASRFVGGYSQNADAKAALDTAMRVAPDASTPEEALAALANQQMELNKQQSNVLSQQTDVNQQQSQQINDLVTDVRRKEKDFRDLNAQIANMPNVTAQQAAKMAQDIEAAHDGDKSQPVSIPDIVAKRAEEPAQQSTRSTRTVSAPTPGASVNQMAQYQQAKDQGAKSVQTTATPKAPQPAKPDAFSQMATQLTGEPPALQALPSRVIKGRQEPARPAQTGQQAVLPGMGATVTSMPMTPAAQQRLAQLGQLGIPQKKVAEAVSPADLQQISTYNNEAFSNAWAHSQSTKLYYGDGIWEDLTFQEVEQIVSAIATDYTQQTRPQVWQQLFSDHDYFEAFKKQHLSQLPLGLKEGDVVPMTDNQTTNQAYADALQFLNFAYANPNDPMITTIRQDFAHKYQQRFQISQAPDRSYYLLDKQLSKKYKLPTPEFKGLEEGAMKAVAMSGQGVPAQYTVVKMVGGDIVPIKAHDSQAQAQIHAKNIKKKYPGMQIAVADESGRLSMIGLSEEPYDGKSAWSDGQGQWSSENNLISSGNNPHGFSEAGSPAQQAAIAIAMKKAGKKPKHVDEEQGVAEAPTDYQKRRQRERDVDMGKPVAKPREPKQTDYQKRRAQDRKDQELGEENKGLYYNVNKRKKAGTSRPAGHPKAPTAQAWKDAARTAKKESVQENYWQRLQRERAEKQHAKAWSLVEQELKDL